MAPVKAPIKKDYVEIQDEDALAQKYRFGDGSDQPAWQALNQVFRRLVFNGIDALDSEFAVVYVLQRPTAFIDLVHGTVVPFESVLYAVPV